MVLKKSSSGDKAEKVEERDKKLDNVLKPEELKRWEKLSDAEKEEKYKQLGSPQLKACKYPPDGHLPVSILDWIADGTVRKIAQVGYKYLYKADEDKDYAGVGSAIRKFHEAIYERLEQDSMLSQPPIDFLQVQNYLECSETDYLKDLFPNLMLKESEVGSNNSKSQIDAFMSEIVDVTLAGVKEHLFENPKLSKSQMELQSQIDSL